MSIKNFGFSKAARLLRQAEYQAVFLNPIRKSSTCLTLLGRQNGKAWARLGIIVAKRYIKSAVDRNWVRRVIKESFRLNQTELCGLDIVVLVKCNITKIKHPKFLANSLNNLWQEISTG